MEKLFWGGVNFMRKSVRIVCIAVMFVSLCMVTLTVLHGYGVIGGKKATAPQDIGENFTPMEKPDGTPDGWEQSTGETIGEDTLPDGYSSSDGAIEAGDSDGNSSSIPPTKPDGDTDFPNIGMGGNEMNKMNGMNGNFVDGRTASGTLGGHLLFATIWIFLFAFALALLIFGRKGRTINGN